MLFEESDFIPEVVPLLEGDGGNRGRLEGGNLWVCHLEHGSLGLVDVSANGVIAEE